MFIEALYVRFIGCGLYLQMGRLGGAIAPPPTPSSCASTSFANYPMNEGKMIPVFAKKGTK